MPPKGFKSITVCDDIYDRWQKVYNITKEQCAEQGINSFMAFITNKLLIHQNIILKKKNFECVSIINEKFTVILKDDINDAVVQIRLKDGNLSCSFCKSEKCAHIGFCYSLHQIYSWWD